MTRDKTSKAPKAPKIELAPTPVERIVSAVGSAYSLIVHTIVFAGFFLSAALGLIGWELMFLVLTTVVSLEAIYLALFIQITVNRHTESLKEVEEDIEEISEDLEELGEDVEDIQEDIEEISEDIDEIQEDVEELNEEEEGVTIAPVVLAQTQEEVLERLTNDVARVLAELEALKKAK